MSDTPNNPPAETPPAPSQTVTPASTESNVTSPPPPAPTTVTSHSDAPNNNDRLDRIEGAVAGLTETVAGLVSALTPPDSTPEKKPWTHWGSK